ncbi:DUF4167 domain-containing protein [uncultured Kiloniella sp.]|uniref:DUF4167 domain-containing protein n=1 Tax=uncultured Kiloniella sp. TaxID=1133091 RepID=UPI00260E8F2D|nr:DUF4167 domain-containing protein [uncultured Kiloniella sp.]
MRQQNSNNSNRRPRGRSNNSNRKPQQSRNGVFDSNGPGGRIRGNASQLKEKYLQMARDAAVGGDRVAAESFYQFAEHYFRVINDSTDPNSGRTNQSDNNYRNRNTRNSSDGDTKAIDGNIASENEAEAQPTIVLNEESLAEEEVPKPARGRVRTRRPRYEASDDANTVDKPAEKVTLEIKTESEAAKATPAVVELPLGAEETPAEKPKRRTRTRKVADTGDEVKAPRPRGRPRKNPVEKDTTETA